MLLLGVLVPIFMGFSAVVDCSLSSISIISIGFAAPTAVLLFDVRTCTDVFIVVWFGISFGC